MQLGFYVRAVCPESQWDLRMFEFCIEEFAVLEPSNPEFRASGLRA